MGTELWRVSRVEAVRSVRAAISESTFAAVEFNKKKKSSHHHSERPGASRSAGALKWFATFGGNFRVQTRRRHINLSANVPTVPAVSFVAKLIDPPFSPAPDIPRKRILPRRSPARAISRENGIAFEERTGYDVWNSFAR